MLLVGVASDAWPSLSGAIFEERTRWLTRIRSKSWMRLPQAAFSEGEGMRRVLRGGGWNDLGYCCRSAYRSCDPPRTRSSNYGFRVVIEWRWPMKARPFHGYADVNTLLQAIACEPEDMLGWLALADALEEGGQDDRAELTRLALLLREELACPLFPSRQARLRTLLRAGVKPCVPTVTNSIGMKLAIIPPGKFLMGSPASEDSRYSDEGPQHEVQIGRPICMGVYPVMQVEWQAVMDTNPSRHQGGDLPVESVTWFDAVEFCKRLTEREKDATGLVYRLPTEAEWEYACHAGTTTRFSLGDSEDALRDAGHFASSSTRAVGRLMPNAFGLHDMHGNVWEWCSSEYLVYPLEAAEVQPLLRADREEMADTQGPFPGPAAPYAPGRQLGLRGQDLPVGLPQRARADVPVQRPGPAGRRGEGLLGRATG